MKILLILLLLCACKKTDQPIAAKEKFILSLASERINITTPAYDSIPIFSTTTGTEIGLTLLFKDSSFSLQAFYSYQAGIDKNATGTLNDTSFYIAADKIYFQNSAQGAPVQMIITHQ